MSLVKKVQARLLGSNCQWDEEWNEFTWEIEASEVYDEDGRVLGSEYQGRKVTLNKPFRTPDGPLKSLTQQDVGVFVLDITVVIPDLNGRPDIGHAKLGKKL